MNLKSENLLTFYSAANKGGNMLSNLQHEFGMREFADHFFAKSKGTILNCQLSVQQNIFNDNTHHVYCKNFNFLNCLFDCSGNLSKPRAADQVRRGGNHLRRGQLHRHSRSGKDIFSPPSSWFLNDAVWNKFLSRKPPRDLTFCICCAQWQRANDHGRMERWQRRKIKMVL